MILIFENVVRKSTAIIPPAHREILRGTLRNVHWAREHCPRWAQAVCARYPGAADVKQKGTGGAALIGILGICSRTEYSAHIPCQQELLRSSFQHAHWPRRAQAVRARYSGASAICDITISRSYIYANPNTPQNRIAVLILLAVRISFC